MKPDESTGALRPTYLEREVPAPQAICEVLEEAGIDTVIGMPGGDVVRIFDALYDHQDRIRTMLVRDETLAGFMAEAYGRAARKPAVVIAQGAWFLGKASMGALEAFAGASPMLVLVDLSDKIPYSHHSPSQSGSGHYGNWDARQSLRGFCKQVMEAHDPVQAVQLTQLAIKHAMEGCPGPVAVIFYGASLRGSVGPGSKPPLHPSAGYLRFDRRSAEPARIAEAAALLQAARNPVIVAGNGVRVSGGFEALQQLAEKLGAPVVTSSAGKGVFPEVHPLAAGVMGEYGLDAAAEVVGEADVVLAVGTRLAPNETINNHPRLIDPRRQAIVQIDIEPKNAGWTHPVRVGLVGDADRVLRDLVATVEPDETRMTRARERVARAAVSGFFEVGESASDAVPILPQRLIRDLCAALPEDAIVTADAGENRIFLLHHYRTKRAGGFLMASSMAGMGAGIPAAMGVKLVHPRQPVVAVCGDGGFGMSMAGLMSSLELDLPITVVVFNNGALGWVEHVQGERVIASRLGDYDHAAIARAIGCEGIRVERPRDIRLAVATALTATRTTVIDLVISREESWEKVACGLRRG